MHNAGAPLTLLTRRGHSVVHLAAEQGRTNALAYLLNFPTVTVPGTGAPPPSADDREPCPAAEAFRLSAPVAETAKGLTALQLAVQNGHLGSVRLLVDGVATRKGAPKEEEKEEGDDDDDDDGGDDESVDTGAAAGEAFCQLGQRPAMDTEVLAKAEASGHAGVLAFLQLRFGDRAVPATAVGSRAGPAGLPPVALVVNDALSTCKFLRTQLERGGIVVETAENGLVSSQSDVTSTITATAPLNRFFQHYCLCLFRLGGP